MDARNFLKLKMIRDKLKIIQSNGSMATDCGPRVNDCIEALDEVIAHIYQTTPINSLILKELIN